MADIAAPSQPAAPAKPKDQAPAPVASPASSPATPASVTLGEPAAGKPNPAEGRARDSGGKFLPADQSVDLQDKLWGEGRVDVAPEDRAVASLDGDGTPAPEVKLRVQRPYKTTGESEPGVPDPASVTLDGAAGVEPAGVPPTEPVPPVAPEAEPEIDLSAPENVDKLIELVIDGSPTVYKNRAHLVQAVKSLRGMYNTAERDRLRVTQANQSNYQTARSWEGIARSLGYKDGQAVPSQPAPAAPADPQGRSQAPGSQGQDAAGRQAASAISDATGAPEEAIAAAVDWDIYNEIKKSRGSEVALLWANAKMIHAATTKTSQRIEEMQRPLVEARAETQLGEEYGNTMLELADWTNTDGSPSYPELSDDRVLTELGYVLSGLQKQGMTPEFLKTKRGMHTAILVWRDYRAAKGNPWRPASQPTPAPPSDAANPAPDQDIEQAVASVARTVTARSAPARPASTQQARNNRIKESILTSDKNPYGDEFNWAR